MKRGARSRIIEDFLAAVEFGKIVAIDDDRDGANQRAILRGLTEALQSILDGDKPDVALALQRKKGPAANSVTLHLAMLIEIARKRGDNWSTIEYLANCLLRRSGREKLTIGRLKGIHSSQKTEALRLLGTVHALREGAERGAFERISPEAASLMNTVRSLELFVSDPDSIVVACDKS